MKIAILTHPLGANYGGILQAYALISFLQKKGHEVVVIQNSGKIRLHERIFSAFKRSILKIICNGSKSINNQIYTDPFVNLRDFVEKKIPIRRINQIKDIKSNEYEAFVVGSDQVWRRCYYDKIYRHLMYSTNILDAFLNFANKWDVKRYSYAASMGINVWEYDNHETKEIRRLAKKFDGISVREDDACELFKSNTGLIPHHHIDPTLLFDSSFYRELYDIDRNHSSTKPYLLTYFLDPTEEKYRYSNHLAKKWNLETIDLSPDSKVNDGRFLGVDSWLSSFDFSTFILTDSFHGSVFSIIFRKPFITFSNIERGNSRLESLFRMFDLGKHMYCDEATHRDMSYFEIDKSIEINLEKYRKEADMYLSNI